MLALQEHFTGCSSCEREMHSIQQLKALLRGLREPRLPRDFSGGVAMRLEQREASSHGWYVLSLPAPKPQRGRRLVTALALSCLTVLSFVAPFAPEPRDARQTASMLGSSNSQFAVPDASDTILSGRIPDRITLIPVNDLTHLPAGGFSMQGRNGIFIPMEIGVMPVQGSLEIMPRTNDSPFANARLLTFRSR